MPRPDAPLALPTAPASRGVIARPSPAPEYVFTGTKLGRAVLAYMVAAVLGVTLQPFAFRVPRHFALTWPDAHYPGWAVYDAVSNVVLFLPLGFLGGLTYAAGRAGGRTAGRRQLIIALVAGALLSAGIEATQLFEPARFPSLVDVTTNALGAALGAWLYARSARLLGADTPLIGRLALELPVMGLVYVTLPLLTLAGITAGAGAAGARAAGLVALGGVGGALLGTVQRRHLGPRGAARPSATAGAAAAWFAAGALPALATAPRAYAGGALFAAGVTWAVGRSGARGVRAIERRFESEALGRAAPWLAAYLALLPLGDAAAAPRAWGQLQMLRQLEHAAAFTVLGYVLAEAWGRREWRYRRTAWAVALVAVGVALVQGAVGTAAGGAGCGVLAALMLGVSACYGGWIYHLQRAHVRALVAASPRASAAPERRAARAVEARAA